MSGAWVWLPGLGLLALALVGFRGVALIRDPGPARRLALADAGGLAPAEDLPRRGPLTRLVRALTRRWGPVLAATAHRGRRERIVALLAAAGHPGRVGLERYVERKVASTLLGAFLGLLFVLAGVPLLLPGLLVAGWLWPDLALIREARERQARIDRELPDFLDVLAVTVGAGVAFRPALARVAEALGGPLGEEFQTAQRQTDFGASARQALEGVRERNESEALDEFVGAVLQAQELGVPLAQTLVDQAADMRRAAYQRARRRAQRAAPRISLIVTTLIVPASILLIAVALFLGSDIELGGVLG